MKTEVIQIMAGAALLSTFTYVPLLARETLGISEIYVAIIVGAYASASFIASYIFGRAGDIYGRRIVIRSGLLLSTISFAFLLLSSDLMTLFIVRLTNGFCVGMYPGALAAYAYESKMKMGRYATWGSAGWGVGTIFAGYAATFDIYYAFVASTIFLAIAFAAALTLPKAPKIRMSVPLFPIATFKRNMPVYISVLIRHSSASAIWTLWALFLYDIGGDPFTIAIVQAINVIFQIIFMVTITDKIQSRRLISIGLIASAITFASFPFAQNIIQILPSQVLVGFSWACFYVGCLKYVTENNTDRSTASGLLQSMLSLSGVIGPIIAAVIYLIWSDYAPIMFFAALMSLVSFGLFWFSNHRNPKTNLEPIIDETPELV
ncbi:MFS transporter [Candidatus Thorarchaeota archaeon]|nr:MAG: MFS transporter [Candidatus Thorarchaeota archaeon]